MKRLFPLLFLFLFITSLPSTANGAPANQDFVYAIHIGAFVKAKISDFEDIRPFGYIYAEEFDPSLLRIYMGDYESEAAAKKVIAKVKAKGYSEAYITGRALAKGKEVAVIQLASKPLSEAVDWRQFAKAGLLQVLSDSKNIKITSGSFASAEQARQRLGSIRKLGFKDAFVKTLNDVYLHPVTSFEAGPGFRPGALLTVDMDDEQAPRDVPPPPSPNTTIPKDIPQTYDVIAEKSPASSFALPNIRVKVKRNSVIELQKELKAIKTYNSSLDGMYGKGTARGYETALSQMPQLRKYSLLAKYSKPASMAKKENILQHYVNKLLDDTPAAMKGLESSKEPIAKAYRAYVLSRNKGSQVEIDALMNTAIKEAFGGKHAMGTTSGFNHNATYTYTSFDQLLQHIRFIQAASAKELAVPCWMFEQHPKEAAKAFGGSSQAVLLADCERFMQWDEIKLLATITHDLNPAASVKTARAATDNSRRAMLALSPQPLSALEKKQAEDWHTALQKGLKAWAAKDPLHQKLVRPLRIAYFQSFVRLEDFYMDKGFKAKEARGLALAVLHSLVDAPLAAYQSK